MNKNSLFEVIICTEIVKKHLLNVLSFLKKMFGFVLFGYEEKLGVSSASLLFWLKCDYLVIPLSFCFFFQPSN